jgi:hypothetical protein
MLVSPMKLCLCSNPQEGIIKTDIIYSKGSSLVIHSKGANSPLRSFSSAKSPQKKLSKIK